VKAESGESVEERGKDLGSVQQEARNCPVCGTKFCATADSGFISCAGFSFVYSYTDAISVGRTIMKAPHSPASLSRFGFAIFYVALRSNRS
jgi:hypothetical protein